MAYQNNYQKLLEDIRSSGQGWSTYDLDLAKKNPDAGRSIYTQKKALASASTPAEKQAAHDAAELIRRKYGGYSGGEFGADFTLAEDYAPPREDYVSKYQDQIQGVLSGLRDREPFSYSPKADPGYQAYAETYRNLGRKAAADTLGSAAAMTGGVPSSYALTASQQAQDGYNARLSDAIPQLQQLAYQMYQGELDQQRADLSALAGLDQQDYGRYADSRNDALNTWQMNAGADRDRLGDQRYAQEYGDARDDAAFDRALAKWQLTGALDPESAKVLGLAAGTKTASYAAKAASPGKGRETGETDGGDYDALFAAAKQAASPQNFIAANYKRYGFTSPSGLSAAYKTWSGNGAASPSFDYDQDEGIFTFNGKRYSSANELASDIERSNLTAGQKDALARKFALFGFRVAFD